MKFILKKTSHFASDEDKAKYEKLGFRFRPENGMTWDKEIKWASKEQSPIIINLDSLEALMSFVREYDDLIVSSDDGLNTIEIYDGYRE